MNPWLESTMTLRFNDGSDGSRKRKAPPCGGFRGGTRVEGLEPSTAGFVDRKRTLFRDLVPDSVHPFHTLRREDDSREPSRRPVSVASRGSRSAGLRAREAGTRERIEGP